MIVSNLTKSFGQRCLFKNLSFSVEKGILLLKGDSGSGKTTLLKILQGLEGYDSGTIKKNEDEENFSYAGQDDTLLFEFSFRQNFENIFKTKLDERVEKLINLFSFEQYVDKKLFTLSGGERQKAELIVALYREVKVYYLDEPFSSLDDESKEKLVLYLNTLQEDHLIVLINHDTTLDNLLVSLTLFFKNGEVTIQKVERKPQKTETDKPIENKTYVRKNIGFAFKAAWYSSKAFYIIEALFIFASFICFGLGTSYLNTKNASQSLAISLSVSPFNTQRYCFSFDEYVSETYFASCEDVEALSLSSREKPTYFYSFLDEDKIYYFRNDKDEDPLFTEEETFMYASGKKVPIEFITRDSSILDDIPSFEQLQMILDGFDLDSSFALTSSAVIDSILIKKAYSENYLPYIYSPSFSIENGNSVYDSVDYTLTIDTEKEGYYLAVPKKMQSKNKVTIVKNLVASDRLSFDVQASTEDESIVLSKDLLRYFLLLQDQDYYLISDNSTLIERQALYPTFSVKDIIVDNSKDGNHHLLYYCLSGFFFFASLLFYVLTFKRQKKNIKTIYQIYQNNALSTKHCAFGLLLVNFVNYLIPTLLTFLLYPTLFLSLSNHTLMVQKYQFYKPEGYYYYSRQPLNNYYDNLTSPVAFETFEPFFLLLLAFFLLSFLLFGLHLLRKRKRK